MSWTCHGSSNSGMVAALKREFVIVLGAMLALTLCGADAPQPLGCGATISAPHMHAVLDVGSGSGYLALVFAAMGDGFAGYPDWAPFDAIHALVVVDKDAEGHVSSRREMGVMYVPLTTEHAQRSRAGSGAFHNRMEY
eukprot:XP_001702854.1 predicted protein [Chlamydomonas reinhardtii]